MTRIGAVAEGVDGKSGQDTATRRKATSRATRGAGEVAGNCQCTASPILTLVRSPAARPEPRCGKPALTGVVRWAARKLLGAG